MIDPKWVKIYAEYDLVSAHLLQAMLEENGIETRMLNQKDSNYGFGSIEIFVRETDHLKALQIVNSYVERKK